MAKLYQQYPTDLEAGAFYALSLLAAERPDDTSLAAEKKAVAVLNPLFQQQPDHPGLAHYIIHSCDSPQMAPLGLDAARRYAGHRLFVSPRGPHAVAYFRPAGAVARGHPGEPEVGGTDREVGCDVHAWTCIACHALSACMPTCKLARTKRPSRCWSTRSRYWRQRPRMATIQECWNTTALPRRIFPRSMT